MGKRGTFSTKKKSKKPAKRVVVQEESEDDVIEGLEIASEFEDEEIDEGAAFNEEDEERYGLWFAKNKDNYEELENTVRVEAERIGSTVMDLSEMLDDAPAAPSITQDSGEEQEEDEEEEEEDEEDDDDDDEEEEDVEEDVDLINLSSGEEDSSDNDDQHDKLVSLLSKMERRDRSSRNRAAEKLMKEGESLPSTVDDVDTNNAVLPTISLDDLTNPLRGSAGFADVKRTLDRVRSNRDRNTASVPVEATHRQKFERKVGYKKTTGKISRWTHLVKANREAEHLSFPLDAREPHQASIASLSSKFKASDSLEKDLEAILDKYGMQEGNLEEQEKLEMNVLDAEEAKKRHEEVSKLRSLMFYHELKAKRIKKIKSRKYRKIRKKLLEKNQGKELSLEELNELDPKLAEEERAKREMERAEARMRLRTKNTSKWMKEKLRHGRMDDETLQSVAEQQRNVELLKRRMQSVKDLDDEDDDFSDDDDDCGVKQQQKLQELESEVQADVPLPTKGLFALKFMRRASDKKQQQAKDMLEEFERAALEDIDENDVANDNDDDDKAQPAGRRKFGDASKSSAEPVVVESGDVKLLPNSLQTSQIGLGDGVKSRTDAPLQLSSTASTTRSLNVNTRPLPQRDVPVEEDAVNPWIGQGSSSRGQKAQKSAQTSRHVTLDPTKTLDVTASASTAVNLLGTDEQEELVREAFATAVDVEAEFEAEKAAVMDADVPDVDDAVLPDWGQWAGQGVTTSAGTRKRQRLRNEAQQGRKRAAIQSRQDFKLSHVIINEKLDRKAAKYLVDKVPYPYTSREQYERRLETPIGRDWNTSSVHADMIRPEISCKMGVIIDPITYSKPREEQPDQ